MKRLPLSVILCLLANFAFSQNTTIAVYGGIVVSRLTGDEDKVLEGNARFSRKVGFQGGVMINVPLNDLLKIHTGIGYAQRGTQIESQDFSPYPNAGIYYSKVKIDYLEFPVMLSLGNEFMYLMAGPQLAFIVHSDAKGVRSEDVGLKYGAGFEFGRYVTAQLLLYHGLTNLTGNSEVKMNNRYMSLNVGARIFRFKSDNAAGNTKKSKKKKEFEVPHRTLD